MLSFNNVEGFSYSTLILVNGPNAAEVHPEPEQDHPDLVPGAGPEKDTLDVWCNGQKMLSNSEFVEDGSQTRFVIGEHEIVLKAFTEQQQQKGRRGIIYCLLVDGAVICS
uniref:Uncharacterized protein n=1 Tax=Knipowitschia caucasica TaxID=637954 RepID=A0AAV2L6H8_KNICA